MQRYVSALGLTLLFACISIPAMADEGVIQGAPQPDLVLPVPQVLGSSRRAGSRALHQWSVMRGRDFFEAEVLGNSDVLSVYAFWRLLTPEFREIHDARDQRILRRLSEPDITVWKGFLIGRLKVEVPAWWLSIAKTGHLLEGSHFYGFDYDKVTEVYESKFAPHDGTLRIEKCCDANTLDNVLVFSPGDNRSLAIPLKFFDEERHPHGDHDLDSISVAWSEDRAYVLFFSSSYALLSSLTCFSLKDSVLLWTTTVWCGADNHIMGPNVANLHVATIGIVRDNVVVFGSSGETLYIEIYHAADGRCAFRFSSNLWFGDEEMNPEHSFGDDNSCGRGNRKPEMVRGDD